MGRTRVKICGIRSAEHALAAVDAGADAVGFVFVEDSPRAIEPEDAAEILVALPAFVSSVALFRDPDPDVFAEIESVCPTTHTQLHGDESEALVGACGPAIKAIRFDGATIAQELVRWAACADVDAMLVDGSAGGAGTTLDWHALRRAVDEAKPEKPVILAGGLTPENVGEAIAIVRPYAVDVSSGVERSRGEKDVGLIAAFCRAVRRADVQLEG
ncbi:MAG: phosphoribosylanthranilate isomerase [Phycisphaerales bacterium]|nr:phosphoribosylanthranilate isomerase [Phycisphaerales bacterium]